MNNKNNKNKINPLSMHIKKNKKPDNEYIIFFPTLSNSLILPWWRRASSPLKNFPTKEAASRILND